MTAASVEGARARAQELESEVVRFPDDERGAILLDAADAWERAGDLDRATALLVEVLALGGDDAGYARHGLAKMCFDRGADGEGWAHLRTLEQSGPLGTGPAELVAELLEQRGDYEAALGWFDRAVDADGERASPSVLGELALLGRQRCREKLGLPADDLDRAADAAEQRRRDFARTLEQAVAVRSEAASRPARLEMLVWQRAERHRAAQRWPEVFPQMDNYVEVEQWLRRASHEHHGAGVTLVVGSADGLGDYLDRTGGDPAAESVRLGYAAQARAQGATITWPPGRNQPCWCGSMRKYKKCCGGPITTVPVGAGGD